MVSRRSLLHLGAGVLAAAAGCLGTRSSDSGDGGTATSRDDTPGQTPGSAPDGADDAPRRTPGDVPEWDPEWTLPFDGWGTLGLDAADGRVYATLGQQDGPAAVAAVDPAERDVLWETRAEGGAVAGSHAADRQIARGKWGVTPTDEAVYAVAGPIGARRRSAVHALDPASGERRWSVQRERELAVAGVADGLVVATGLEFFPPPRETAGSGGGTPSPAPTHATPESPLSTVVYGLDAADGTVRWTREFVDVQDVTVGDRGVYVAAGDRLAGLGLDGSRRFTYDHGPATRVAAGDGRVFYLTGEEETATLHGVAPNGDWDWRRDVPAEELLVGGERVYAGGDAVAGFETDGTPVWRDNAHGQWLLFAPGGGTLYTRSGERADAATAYDVETGKRWVFDPPSSNAWPEAATRNALVASAINEGGSDEPFLTVYILDSDGHATAARGTETVFDALGLDGTVYLADGVSDLVAVEP